MSDQERLEESLTHSLQEEPLDPAEAQEEARRRLSPKYEIRIQVHIDPIAEETRWIRRHAREIDNRYDSYVPSCAEPAAAPDDSTEENDE